MTLSAGSIVTIQIEDVAFGGEGVARHEDFVIFVPFVLPGETVEAELIEVKKRFGRARLLRIISTASERVKPGCRYFGECGGCQYQHVAYETQLKIKHKQIKDLFERVGEMDPRIVAEVLPCPTAYGYRNRIMIRSQWDKPRQALNIGYIRADSRLVIDIEECPIAEPALNEQIKLVRANPPPKGGLKVVLRVMPEDWEVPKDSFFQNNFHLLPVLVNTTRDMLRDAKTRHLVDVYCGVGFFSLELAHLVGSFAGVELDRLAIKAARNNAVAKNIRNGEFISGAAEEVLPELLKKFEARNSTVLLDPPRKGCYPGLVDLLRATGPRQIIYVSCHPATMARDLKDLCAGGLYEIRRAQPLDMFPQTSHVEVVADLQLRADLRSPENGNLPSTVP